MRANVKPLTHWVIYKEYSVRFTARTAEAVAGWLTVPGGAQVAFTYDPGGRVITLPDRRITINDYGWEISSEPATAAGEESA